jgi:hypothetical protein
MERQYIVTVKSNSVMPELQCNGGYMKPQSNGDYMFSYCEKESDGNYVAVGFAPVFIPKEFIIGVKLHAFGDFAL